MINKKILILLGTLFVIGCGGEAESESVTSLFVPEKFLNKVINNRGLFVEGRINGYTIKIYSDSIESANSQAIHKGIVVRLNGKASEVMPIQISYLNKKIVVVLVNAQGEEVSVSSKVLLTDIAVVVIEMTL